MNENNAIQQAAQDVRAREEFPYHDVVSIGIDQGDTEGWFNSLLDLGNAEDVHLFNVRSRSTVGLAYCNLDSPSLFDVGYLVKNIGVQFEAPIGQQVQNTGDDPPLLMPYINAVFQDLLEDCGLQFFLNQDEKLAGNVSHFPAGYGTFGHVNAINGGASVDTSFGTVGTYTNGAPEFQNQWVFKQPIEIPRNHNVRVVLKFSEFAKNTLKNMGGPGFVMLGSGSVSGASGYKARLNLKVTVNGTRLVQLRNAQTYR
jgi:hypothetical protein